MVANTKIVLEGIYSLEKKPDLYKIYTDLSKMVEAEHSDLPKDKIGQTLFKLGDQKILDAYKSILHLVMLKKIPGFEYQEVASPHLLISEMFTKFGIKHDYDKIEETKAKIQTIVDNHCGQLIELTIHNRGES